MLNRTEKILLYGSNLWYLGEGMLGPLFAVFAERIGGDVLEISWAWALFLLLSGLFQIIAGKLTDFFSNYERVMVVGYALNAICTFGYLFVSSPAHLFIVQAGLGIASGIASPTWNALYAKHENRKIGGFTWGLANGEAQIVTSIALVIGGFVVAHHSFTALFITMGIIQTIATLYQAQILRTRGLRR